MNKALTADERASLLLKEMRPEEKGRMLGGSCMSCPYVGKVEGNDRLGIPPLNTHDGPQGFRNRPFADYTSTSWPGAMTVSATWDVMAVEAWGQAMGKEFYRKGANVQLGPGLNVARVPRNGRNFEYLSGEDPYLGWVLAGPLTRGIQYEKVIACGKHYVANSAETHRMDGSEDLSTRALFEVYYPPFESAVRAGLGSIMCSYNQVNGAWGCENNETLNTHLRGDLGFKGFVMSDWGATHSAALKEGLDMEMPQKGNMHLAGFAAKHVQMEDVDRSVHRILRTMFDIGVMDEPASAWDAKKYGVNVSTPEFDSLARNLAADGMVMLKNGNETLPMPHKCIPFCNNEVKKLALIGFAGENCANLIYGHGSGEVPPSHLVTPLAAFKEALGDEVEIVFDKGHNLEDAARTAKEADFAIVFVGASATEGGDRANLNLDNNCRISVFGGKTMECDGNDANQNALVLAVARAQPRTVAVLNVPGAILMPWANEVNSIIMSFMPGQQFGNAIADLILGKVNPNGKLPVTMPNIENEMSFTQKQFPGVKLSPSDRIFHLSYDEELLVGYRWYEAHHVEFTTGFPFGHGLTYSIFEYKDLEVNSAERKVSFTIEQVEAMAGREVAQLYLSFPEGYGEPPMQLKGFKKTRDLGTAAKERIEMVLTERDTSYFDEASHSWRNVKGTFKFFIGASSRDIRLTGELEL